MNSLATFGMFQDINNQSQIVTHVGGAILKVPEEIKVKVPTVQVKLTESKRINEQKNKRVSVKLIRN